MIKIPQLLQTEHKAIHDALAEATNVRSEEEVLYPAAILVGVIIRTRMAQQ